MVLVIPKLFRATTPSAKPMADLLQSRYVCNKRRSTSTTSNAVDSTKVRESRSSSHSDRRHLFNFNPLDQFYEQQVKCGLLLFDRMQQRAARKLTHLQLALNEYDHAAFLEQLKMFEQHELEALFQ